MEKTVAVEAADIVAIVNLIAEADGSMVKAVIDSGILSDLLNCSTHIPLSSITESSLIADSFMAEFTISAQSISKRFTLTEEDWQFAKRIDIGIAEPELATEIFENILRGPAPVGTEFNIRIATFTDTEDILDIIEQAGMRIARPSTYIAYLVSCKKNMSSEEADALKNDLYGGFYTKPKKKGLEKVAMIRGNAFSASMADAGSDLILRIRPLPVCGRMQILVEPKR